MEGVSQDKDAALPDLGETRRRLQYGQRLTSTTTVGDLLDEWLEAKQETKRATTVNNYASRVEYHLRLGLGHHRLDRLNAGHCQTYFDGIDDVNDLIGAENTARRQQRAGEWGKRSRPPGVERERLDAERAKLAAMPPCRRITAPATKLIDLRPGTPVG